jgi:hypothetical protein
MYRTVKMLLRGNAVSPLAAGSVLTTDTNTARGGSLNSYFEICLTGSTAQRPVPHVDPDYSVGIPPGLFYYDSTLSDFIVWDGSTWRNPISGASV